MRQEENYRWWELGCSFEQAHELIAKHYCELDISSMIEKEGLRICVGSWMHCVRLYRAIKPFKVNISFEKLSRFNQGLFLTFTLLKNIVKKDFLVV